MNVWLLATALFATLPACAQLRPILADDQDLADYRAFRVAAHPGRRLTLADAYLRAHPNGAWSADVRAEFDHDEPLFFERAKTSRNAARDYLSFLPKGPHADQALALMTSFDTSFEEIEINAVIREVRRSEATLEAAAVARRAVGETVIAMVVALIDENVYHASIQDAPPALRALLSPSSPASAPTWGAVPSLRESDLFFMLPTRPERQSRVASIALRVGEGKDGHVNRAVIEGEDLFVRWQEADQIVALDPTSLSDRTEAGVHALDILSGTLEARFPRDRCADASAVGARDALYARACDGLRVTITMGDGAGARDRIVFSAQKDE